MTEQGPDLGTQDDSGGGGASAQEVQLLKQKLARAEATLATTQRELAAYVA